MLNKRFNENTSISIQGVNPGLGSRDENNNSSQTSGKVILKRQQLLACPYLQVDEQIKLLNLQKNCITKIANLEHLISLVVLDLCENEIEQISGLDCLISLRILRLANNKIRQIRNLDNLRNLDVLDLNGNQISRIENCKNLTQLRVLNLAFNRIEKCENIKSLQNLVELNLQGNLITSVTDLDSLPIQRLFLSFNKIRRFDDIRCISKLTLLECLSLEGNPLAFTAAYEQIILSQSTNGTKPHEQQQPRQTVSFDQRINRVVRLKAPPGLTKASTSDSNINNIERNNLAQFQNQSNSQSQQDSQSERSDTEFDTNTTNLNRTAPQVLNRTTSSMQPQRNLMTSNKIPNAVESPNSLSTEKLNPIIHERSLLAKNLVQQSIKEAFQKEASTIELTQFWPVLFTQITNEALRN